MKARYALILFLSVFALSAFAAQKADFYISPDGNDNNPGTIKKPFASITRAKIAVRELKKKNPKRDYRVLLRGGTYRIRETIVFSYEDSAKDNYKIAYLAYPGEKPIISSGVPITGWEKTEFAAGKVWSAPMPHGLKNFYTLYKGNKRLPRARSKGFTSTVRSKKWHSNDHSTFMFPKGYIQNWPDLDNAELVLVTSAPWTMNILPVASVDEETSTLRTAIPGTYALSQPRFGEFKESAWIENVMDALDQPGEWVLDTNKRTIYYWPKSGKPGSDILAPALTELIRLEGDVYYSEQTDFPIKGLVFAGLTFTHADRFTWNKFRIGRGLQHDWEMFDQPSAMFRMRGAENCSIMNCYFVNAGATGIRLDLHCIDNLISRNVIEHIGGIGILLCGYGPGTKDLNKKNRVTQNHIHHIGEIYWHSPGIFAWQSGENLIVNNLIHNTPYTGIVVSGRIAWDRNGKGECSQTVRWDEIDKVLEPGQKLDWYTREPFTHARKNQVARNEIHNVMEVMTDGNGIYVSGAGRENVVSENFIHDCPNKHFAEGIRCDDDQHETIIERNIVWRLGGLATFVTIKGMNHVRNNIFACPLNPPHRGMLSLELHKNSFLDGAEIQRNIFYSTNKTDKICFQGKNYYGASSFLRDAITEYNLYYNSEDPEWGKRHLDAEQTHHSEMHSQTGDPLFVDPEKGDFKLKADSPALKLGFEPIDMSKIGLNK